MVKFLAPPVFALGGALVGWMGSAFGHGQPLALVVTAAIGLCYLAGSVELARFHLDTGRLRRALGALPESGDNLDNWLAAVPATLRDGVRRRLAGEPAALPMPVLTPYLTGLLVMLGLLGTFAGMVATLQGAVTALEGTTELEAIRRGLTAPIAGLGMAFGTSVAGVSASAALGFMATLCRRERLTALRHLERAATHHFPDNSAPAHRRQVLEALREQNHLLPALTEQLTALATGLDQRLVSGQERFHQHMLDLHRGLADDVGRSLRESLAESGRLAGESVRPALEQAMASLAEAARDTSSAVRDSAALQLDGMARELEQLAGQVSERWLAGLAEVQTGFSRLREDAALAAEREQGLHEERRRAVARIGGLLDELQRDSRQQKAALASQGEALAVRLTTLADQEARRGEEQAERLRDAQLELNRALEERYRTLAEGLARDLAAATTAQGRQALEVMQPLVADALAAVTDQAQSTRQALTEASDQQAKVLAGELQAVSTALKAQWRDALEDQRRDATLLLETVDGLRQRAQDSLARETTLYGEQQALARQLAEVAGAVRDSVHQQQAALEAFAGRSGQMLSDMAGRVDSRVADATGRLASASEAFATGAAEFASLGDALLQVAAGFEGANRQLEAAARQLEEAVAGAARRSDEQMGYYVAQAREVIDHSVLAQQALIDQMRQLSRTA